MYGFVTVLIIVFYLLPAVICLAIHGLAGGLAFNNPFDGSRRAFRIIGSGILLSAIPIVNLWWVIRFIKDLKKLGRK